MEEKEPSNESYPHDDFLTQLTKTADPEAELWGTEDFLRAGMHKQNEFLHHDVSHTVKEQVARSLYDELFPGSSLSFTTDYDGRQECWRVAENIHELYQGHCQNR